MWKIFFFEVANFLHASDNKSLLATRETELDVMRKANREFKCKMPNTDLTQDLLWIPGYGLVRTDK
jgi:hypothetical protein